MRVSLPLAAVAAALFALPCGASAATFEVTKTTDDLTCTTGDCSLRGAIHAANSAPGDDTVTVPAGHYALTRSGGDDDNLTGDLDVRGQLTINGAGAGATIVDAGGLGDRVFDVQPEGGSPFNAVIRDLTAQGGYAGFQNGGGVRNSAYLILQRVILADNAAGEGGGVAHESATSLLQVIDSTIRDNFANLGGGVNVGSGAHSETQPLGLLVERSSIVDNVTGFMGEGPGGGGGINQRLDSDVRVHDSTVAGNIARDGGFGGGFSANNGVLELTNTTVSGNGAVGEGAGGGGFSNANDPDVELTNVTVADNFVDQDEVAERSLEPGKVGATATDPGDDEMPGGNFETHQGTWTFENTIVTGGAPQNCSGRFGSVYTSLGHNLESANTCGFDQATDLRDTDPLLAALANNGGPTQTRALLHGSPAIDSADDAACPGADQRGVSRPQPAGGNCDRGAFERAYIDLAVQKLASASSVTEGEQVTFTIPVSNAGAGGATDVTLTDTLPDGLTFVSATPSQGTCSGTQAVTCSLGAIESGQSVDVVIKAVVTRAGTFTNTATVSGGGELADSNAANNTASATVTGTAKPGPGPGPDPEPTPCVDVTPPITELTQRNVRVRRGRVHLSGTTRDADQCASGVNRVLVSLARVRGRHLVNCRFLKSRTEYRLTKAPGMNCQDPVLFLAKGGATQGTASAKWSFIFLVDLPDGIYRAQARAFDNAGNKETPKKGRNIRKFFVR